MISDKTMNYNTEREKEEKEKNTKQIIKEVYTILIENGYNPVNQLVGYILSGDPIYITSHKDARSLITNIWSLTNMRILSIDYGNTRTGLAITDELRNNMLWTKNN